MTTNENTNLENVFIFRLPKLQLENPKGLKDADVANLLIHLNKEAYALKGEVCIYDLCQHVEEFLHKHDKPPPKSFYEQMVDGKQMRHQIEQNTLKENEEKTKKALHDEVLKRQAQLKNDGRTRRSTLSEISPLHRSNNNSVSEMRNYLNDCDDHRRSEAFYFPTSGKRIQLGSCLGHSQKGCINYSGIDLESGQLYYISEWEIKYSQIEAKNKSVEEVVECECHCNLLIKSNVTNYVYFYLQLSKNKLLILQNCTTNI